MPVFISFCSVVLNLAAFVLLLLVSLSGLVIPSIYRKYVFQLPEQACMIQHIWQSSLYPMCPEVSSAHIMLSIPFTSVQSCGPKELLWTPATLFGPTGRYKQ